MRRTDHPFRPLRRARARDAALLSALAVPLAGNSCDECWESFEVVEVVLPAELDAGLDCVDLCRLAATRYRDVVEECEVYEIPNDGDGPLSAVRCIVSEGCESDATR